MHFPIARIGAFLLNQRSSVRVTISIGKADSGSFRTNECTPMKALPGEIDFIVVGAGIAGLRASVELAPAGRVLCLAKREVTESNTQYAQGGIAAALSDDDEVRLHLEDTL